MAASSSSKRGPDVPTNIFFTNGSPSVLPLPPSKPVTLVEIENEIDNFPENNTILATSLPIPIIMTPGLRMLFINHPVFRSATTTPIHRVFSGQWAVKSRYIYHNDTFCNISSFTVRPDFICDYRLYYNKHTDAAIRFIQYSSPENNVYVLVDAYMKTNSKRIDRPYEEEFIDTPIPHSNTPIDEQILEARDEIDILQHKLSIKRIRLKALYAMQTSRMRPIIQQPSTPIYIQPPSQTPQPIPEPPSIPIQPPPPTPPSYPFSPFSPMPQYDDYLFSYE